MADDSRERNDGEAESSIKVTDRRKFTADGERREDAPEPEPEPPAEDDRPGEEAGFSHTPVDEAPGIDFTTLVNAMATPALIHLGEVPHPDGGMTAVNLEQAQLQIDFLALLRVKCRGNLNHAEENLLDRVLYQLRMLFVTKSGETGDGGKPGPAGG